MNSFEKTLRRVVHQKDWISMFLLPLEFKLLCPLLEFKNLLDILILLSPTKTKLFGLKKIYLAKSHASKILKTNWFMDAIEVSAYTQATKRGFG